MKRRNFIITAVGAFGMPISVAGSSIYGTPTTKIAASLSKTTNLLRLPLTANGIPGALWDQACQVGDIWQTLLTSPKEAEQLKLNPRAYLLDKGIPESALSASDSEVKTLVAFFSQDVQSAIASNDPKLLIQALKQQGALSLKSGDSLKRRIAKIMSQDKVAFAQLFERIQAIPLGDRQKAIDGDEIQYIYSLLSSVSNSSDTAATENEGEESGYLVDYWVDGEVAIVPVAVIAVLTAAVLLYVTVAIAVSVGLVIGITITAVASVVITAEGVGIAKGNAAALSFGAIAEKLSKLDSEFYVEAKRASRVAALSNSKSATISSAAWLIETQVKAVIDAAQETGIIQLPAAIKAELTQHLQHMALRVVNLH